MSEKSNGRTLWERSTPADKAAYIFWTRYLESFPKWAVWAWEMHARTAFTELRRLLESGEVTVERPYSTHGIQVIPTPRNKRTDWPGTVFQDIVRNLRDKKAGLSAFRFMEFLGTDFFRQAAFGAWRKAHDEQGEHGDEELFFPEIDLFTISRKEVAERLTTQALKGEEADKEVLADLVGLVRKPFMFDIDSLEERFDDDMAEAIYLQARRHFKERTRESIRSYPPILCFTWEDEAGNTLDIMGIFEIAPFLMDFSRNRGGFPILVGLMGGSDGEETTLSGVPAKIMEEFWTRLFERLDKIRGPEEEKTEALESLVDGLIRLEKSFEAHPHPLAQVRTILDTPTREDALVRNRISQLNRIKLPQKWEGIPRWEDLVEKRIAAIVAEHGEEEAVRKRLLKRKTSRKGEEKEVVLELGATEKEALRDTLGEKVFREHRFDPGAGEHYAIVKRRKGPDGSVLEIALSWYGLDWKLVKGGRDLAEEAFEGVLARDKARLFPELDPSQVKRLLKQIEHIAFLRDSDRLIAFLVDRFGALGTNVFRIPLWEVKVLFEIENDPHALERINGAFYCLQHLNFASVRSGKNRSEGGYGFGAFIVFYELPKRGDGEVLVEVSEWAIGALKFFESNRTAYPYAIVERPEDPKNKPSGEVVSHDFARVLSAKEKKALSGELKKQRTRIIHKPTISNAYFVNALADGDEKRKEKLLRLLEFMGAELTRRKDPRADKRKELIAKRGSAEAELPRLYDRTFCPLLEERVLAGALGHHKHNPESGRKLYGGSPQPTAKSGAFPEGLLSLLGFHETTKAGRARDIREALLLMAVAVETKLGGLVALKLKDAWLRVPKAIEDETDLPLIGREARIFLFFPDDYVDRLHDIFNAYNRKRAVDEKLPYIPQLTRDRGLHERNDLERVSKAPTVEEEQVIETTAKVVTLNDVTPLHRRLAGARNGRRLTQKQVGEIFGVSAQTIKLWETYERDELGKGTKGRPIPKQIIPLLERWLRERIAPTKEELEVLEKRRPGKRRKE
jgi:hypothetical protein